MEFQKHFVDISELLQQARNPVERFRIVVQLEKSACIYEDQGQQGSTQRIELISLQDQVLFVQVQYQIDQQIFSVVFDPRKRPDFAGILYSSISEKMEAVRLQLFDISLIEDACLAFQLTPASFLLYKVQQSHITIYLPRVPMEFFIANTAADIFPQKEHVHKFDIVLAEQQNHQIAKLELDFLQSNGQQLEDDQFQIFFEKTRAQRLEDCLKVDAPVPITCLLLCQPVVQCVDAFTSLKELQYSVSYVALQFSFAFVDDFAIVTADNLTFDELRAGRGRILRILTNFNGNSLWVLENNKLRVLTGQFNEPAVFYMVNFRTRSAFTISSDAIYNAISAQRPFIQLADGVKLWVQDSTYEHDSRIKSELFKTASIRQERKRHAAYLQKLGEVIQTQETINWNCKRTQPYLRAQYFARFSEIYRLLASSEASVDDLRRKRKELEARSRELAAEVQQMNSQMIETQERRLKQRRLLQIAKMQKAKRLTPDDPRRAQAEEEQRTEFVKELSAMAQLKQQLAQQQNERNDKEREMLMEEFGRRREVAEAEMKIKKEQLDATLVKLKQSQQERLNSRTTQRVCFCGDELQPPVVKTALLTDKALSAHALKRQSSPEKYTAYDEQEALRIQIQARAEQESKAMSLEQRTQLRKMKDEASYQRYLRHIQERRREAKSQLLQRSALVDQEEAGASAGAVSGKCPSKDGGEASAPLPLPEGGAKVTQERRQKQEQRRKRIQDWQPLILQ